jgi:hypothetical protein
MEEEWMRDRALLRDLLEKTPQASPQELAQAIGRGVALGQEVAQATARSVISMTPLYCALIRKRTMRPTSAGMSLSPKDCGDALCSPRELEACAWAPGPALLPSP